MDDDCFAARVATAYRRRFGEQAGVQAARRLTRALNRGDIIKIDLFVAVGVILRDEGGQYRASRGYPPAQRIAAASIAVAAPVSR
ncbi:hypothetical protein SAMN06297144_0701 [Sphingomonas guangdongensis]|uniref:Uncharacterized protein n=1 Tax=Sphingomonas guangdongensis TaxID=1141890 RepID=A0A285QDY2_9SPHN|nr:hypothetical protein [Sphingomonas guangdongensis]SOB79728.1 hypothetical protein SAMN06297144_0701 [Sphingomonas guangdongensis]